MASPPKILLAAGLALMLLASATVSAKQADELHSLEEEIALIDQEDRKARSLLANTQKAVSVRGTNNEMSQTARISVEKSKNVNSNINQKGVMVGGNNNRLKQDAEISVEKSKNVNSNINQKGVMVGGKNNRVKQDAKISVEKSKNVNSNIKQKGVMVGGKNIRLKQDAEISVEKSQNVNNNINQEAYIRKGKYGKSARKHKKPFNNGWKKQGWNKHG